MKSLRTILVPLGAIVGILVGVALSYHVGKVHGQRELLDAVNYDRIREVAFQGFFVAAGRQDVFYRGCDQVIEQYVGSRALEDRLNVEPRERENTERLVVQYYFAQDRPIPPAILPILTKPWNRKSFLFTKENGQKIK